MLGRILVTLGALMLIGTAIFHSLGGAMVSNWLSGERGLVLQALWYVPTLDWSVVGLAWLLIAWRGDHRLAPLVWLLAVIPGGAAAMIGAALGPYFLGFWLLAGATLLAVLGAIALPKAGLSPSRKSRAPSSIDPVSPPADPHPR